MRFFVVRLFRMHPRLSERHCERALSSKRRSKTVLSDPCQAKRAPESFRATPVERDDPRAIPSDPCRAKRCPPQPNETRPRAILNDPCPAKRAPESFRATPVERDAPQGHSERPLSIETRRAGGVDTPGDHTFWSTVGVLPDLKLTATEGRNHTMVEEEVGRWDEASLEHYRLTIAASSTYH